jgi:5-methylcytosine-specific restriction endonuclease McrA
VDHAKRARLNGWVDRKPYREFVLKMRSADKAICFWCGKNVPKTKRRLDHIIPLTKGGPDAVENLCCSCVRCNSSKADKLPSEFSPQLMLSFDTIFAGN